MHNTLSGKNVLVQITLGALTFAGTNFHEAKKKKKAKFLTSVGINFRVRRNIFRE